MELAAPLANPARLALNPLVLQPVATANLASIQKPLEQPRARTASKSNVPKESLHHFAFPQACPLLNVLVAVQQVDIVLTAKVY
jgi:hypothetical protein